MSGRQTRGSVAAAAVAARRPRWRYSCEGATGRALPLGQKEPSEAQNGQRGGEASVWESGGGGTLLQRFARPLVLSGAACRQSEEWGERRTWFAGGEGRVGGGGGLSHHTQPLVPLGARREGERQHETEEGLRSREGVERTQPPPPFPLPKPPFLPYDWL